MKFIKWFFSEVRYMYYFAAIISVFIIHRAIRDISYFINEPWTIPVFILTMGGFIAGMTVSLIKEYKASQK